MSSEVVGPVLIVAMVTVASTGALFWAASVGEIGVPGSALMGVDDHPHDQDGDGVVDGHRVVVEAVSSSVEGGRVEIVIGNGTVRAPALAAEGSGVYVPCSAWQGHVQVVLWTSRASGVFHREVAQELNLGSCPSSGTVDDKPEEEGEQPWGTEVDECPWAPYSLDVEWGLRCLLAGV